MLLELKIESFALVRSAWLELGPGLNVLTGETGAGKSIVIDAVAAVLGGRVGGEAVRQGSAHALVEAAFDISRSPGAAEALRELGLESGDDTLILTREIAAEGRNKCRINGRLANAAHLALVGRALVDIHGQHDHQSLLSASNHITLLDALGGAPVSEAAAEVARLVRRRADLKKAIAGLEAGERERAQREDLLRYQINEIDGARLVAGEEESLAAERLRLGHAERIARAVGEAYGLLYGGDAPEGPTVNALLGSARDRLAEAAGYDEALRATLETLEQSLAAVADAALDLRRYLERVEPDPERLAVVEERLELIGRLKRKYGESTADVLAFRDRAAAELDALESAEERIAELRRDLAEVEGELAGAARRLSAARAETARRAERLIAARLARLEMPHARFQVAIRREADPDGIEIDGERWRVTERGVDVVEFLFSANPGEEVRPLARIASGGEMSRVMLAIKGALAEIDPVGTLVFDEVDAGLGGRAAESVADALAELARTHQVLVVTHLPQIAARADRHIAVEKVEEDGRTSVSLRVLEGEARVREIARMLDGKGTRTGLEHARSLLSLAHKGRTAS